MWQSTLVKIPLWKLSASLFNYDIPPMLTSFADVASQSTSPGWNLGKWADYVDLEPSKRDKILNVISLEISGTELADMVLPPKIVRDLDWVENFWPGTRKGKNNVYPKVQLYCLMGVANAWTVREVVKGIFPLAYYTLPGLAYRLCGVFSVLPHPSRFKGIGVYYPVGWTILIIFSRYFILSGPRQQTSPRMKSGLEASSKTRPG